MDLAQWYRQFYAMKDALFEGSPDDVQQARAFYETIVGDPAIVRLTVALGLKITDGGQDWSIEVADADRVAEFLDLYEQGVLDEEERYHLMELIVASLEEHLQYRERDPALVARFRIHFIEAYEAHRDTVAYWAGIGAEGGGPFALTPLMRQLWEEHGGERYT